MGVIALRCLAENTGISILRCFRCKSPSVANEIHHIVGSLNGTYAPVTLKTPEPKKRELALHREKHVSSVSAT